MSPKNDIFHLKWLFIQGTLWIWSCSLACFLFHLFLYLFICCLFIVCLFVVVGEEAVIGSVRESCELIGTNGRHPVILMYSHTPSIHSYALSTTFLIFLRILYVPPIFWHFSDIHSYALSTTFLFLCILFSFVSSTGQGTTGKEVSTFIGVNNELRRFQVRLKRLYFPDGVYL